MMGSPFPRRRFVRNIAAITAGVAGYAGARAIAAPEAPLVERRLFFDNPDYGSVAISPDGQHLAWLAPIGSVRNLWVAPVDDLGAARPLTRVTDRSLGAFRWAHSNRHIVFFQERDGDENWRASSIDIMSGDIVALTPERGVRAFVQEADRRFPEEMLLGHNQRDRSRFDLFRVNIVTGKSELVYENHDQVELVTDSRFQLRLGFHYDADGSSVYVERQADGGWAPFTTVPITDVDSTWPLDFSDDGKTLFMLDSRGRDKAALVAVDMATRQSRVLAQDDEADIAAAAFDPATRRPIAALSFRARAHWQAIEPVARDELEQLAAFGPGDISFTSRSADNGRVTVYYERDSASGAYVLLDRASNLVRSLFIQRPRLADITLRPMEPVAFPARDGLMLHGYLTRPSAGAVAADGRLPLVLMVHGGPYLRDRWGFSATHQWLADRGYAVLGVNYRGSTGYGKAFVTAADREWGGKMHDDLIDAVGWAVAQGIADRRRIGFYGASYGGYAALTAATKTPDVFACIVDVFGISNLLTFMATVPPYWGPWFSIWKKRLGDPDSEAGRAFLRERSPLTHIARARRPILIAQGMRDVRVVAAESQQMVDALKQRRVPVTYLTFADEGHGFVRPENRMAFYAVVEAFLARYLGGRFQPVIDDFTGSSLRIETGGDLIPGLPP
ncbi:S9 family peptidase [Vineibacter terrae]|uniref:S9 family peptidase n=1 Tax=Vineibacter terrae TaxID=2586908 RepID=UPI002E310933|nr:S9 family peptidase [Vineibacter terrae]HEX2892148.1 S9 family peptidase [Vineibacter terrae]